MAAICLTSLISMAFLFIGQVNVLAPIVTINFMLTYSFIDYSYFSVEMSYKLQVKKTNREYDRKSSPRKPLVATTTHPCYGSGGVSINGTLLEFTKDMDRIFPPSDTPGMEEKKASDPATRIWGKKVKVSAKETLRSSFRLDLNSNKTSEKTQDQSDPDQSSGPDDETCSQSGLIESESGGERTVRLQTRTSIQRNQLQCEAPNQNGERILLYL